MLVPSISCFPFSQFPHPVSRDSLLMMDLFTERPVNRAITTTSPSATAQPALPPKWHQVLCGFFFSFLFFCLYHPESFLCIESSHTGQSVAVDLWLEICLLPLRFSENERKTEFLHTCLPWMGPRTYFLLYLEMGLEDNPTWNNQMLCEECEGMLGCKSLGDKSQDLNCSVDHCQRCKT